MANVDTVEREKSLDTSFPVLQAIVCLPYRMFHECIWLHVLELLRKIMFVTEKDIILIRQQRMRIFF